MRNFLKSLKQLFTHLWHQMMAKNLNAVMLVITGLILMFFFLVLLKFLLTTTSVIAFVAQKPTKLNYNHRRCQKLKKGGIKFFAYD